jgi:RNA polymerase sigma factor (sigma-70 family)
MPTEGEAQQIVEPDQFEAVFQQNFANVHAVVARLIGDPDEAEDLTLEAFWRLWRTPSIEDGSCGPWLFRVASRLGYNALRARARRTAYELTAGMQADRLASDGDPAGEAERRIERQKVRAILARLPARSAQILSLRMAGMSYREIAAVMEVKSSSIGAMLARAELAFEDAYLEHEAPVQQPAGE